MSRIAAATLAAPRRIAGATGIAQDNIIFATILFAFVVWITTKGELPTYIAFFKPGASQGPVTDPITATPSTGATTPSSIPGVPNLNSNPLAGLPTDTPIIGPLLGQPGAPSFYSLPSGITSLIQKFKGLF